jgi:RNA polymerase sigma-70 factor, ECF subfamily
LAQSEGVQISPHVLSLAIRGDREAVTTITATYLPRVYGLCLRIAGRRDVAEEAAQETFVRALRALPGLRKPESFGPWILMIAANTAKEVLRERTLEPLAGRDVAAPEVGGEEPFEARKRALERAVSTLADEEKAIFLLHTVEGVSLEDLARERATSAAAMKSRLHRIRAKVREHAVRYLEEGGDSP